MATILIVGRAADRASFAAILTGAGHRPMEAETAGEALARAQAQPPDLVIVDARLPAAAAAKVAARLRADSATAGIPILLHGGARDSEPGAVLRLVSGALGAPSPADTSRLAAIIQLGMDLAAERDSQRLLQAFCEGAREIIGARYAALGIFAPDGQTLRHFLTSGVDAETAARIGAVPTGKGILGLLAHEGRPLRLRNLGTHPESVGFPPHHPSMTSFLGVPVASPTRIYGRLYLTEKIGAEEFSEEDERLLVTMAAQVAVVAERWRAEEQLRLQSATLEAAANAIVITDRDGRITWANPAFTRLTGWGAQECPGQNMRILKSGRHDSSFYEELWRTILSGRVWQREMVNRRKDGSLYFEEQTITPVCCERGEITHFVGIKVDIGERKAAQEALLQSERRYRALAEAAHDDIFIVDREGRIQYVNAAAAGRLGRPPEEIAGKRLEELFPREIAARFRESLAEVFASGAHRYAEEPTRYGDREVWIGTWLAPLEGDRGEVESVMGVSRDITDRVRAEQALRASEERYRSLFERNLAGVYRTSLEGRILECNDALARIYGYANRGEIVARNASELYPTPEARRLFIERLRERGTLLDFELQGRRKDGSLLWALVNASLVREGGETGALVIEGTAFDITDRKRLEQQLRQAQKMEAIGQLAGGVAHDFNNLLGVIGGHTELALKRLGEGDPLRRHLEEIRQAGDRAAGLTRQLLAFSRKQIVEPTVLDLDEVVRGLEGMLGRLIPEDIQLVTVLGAEPALVSADRGQVEQVVMNLVVNARDAMPEGGRLAIETGHAELDEAYCREHVGARPGPHVMLAVSDTGIGMDAETRSHLFEPFFTTKEPGKGTGLGLSTVYGIVKQAGGSIWVYSEPGQGTTFKMYLPKAEEGEAAARPAVAPGEVPRGTETILLVEDEETLRTLTREILESLGYTVLEARHGVEALELSERHEGRIDLLLTDVVMPQMSGRELAERLGASRPQTRALFISGYTDDAVVRHRLVGSQLAFLQKPFTAEALARKVREMLDTPRAG